MDDVPVDDILDKVSAMILDAIEKVGDVRPANEDTKALPGFPFVVITTVSDS